MTVHTDPRPNRITLQTRIKRVEESEAHEILFPGHLIELRSDGKVQKHTSAGNVAERLVPMEDALQGKTINDAYAADSRVIYLVADPGDRVQLRLAASATAIVQGDLLESAGDGTVRRAAGTDATEALAVAMEDRDNSAGEEEIFIKARFV